MLVEPLGGPNPVVAAALVLALAAGAPAAGQRDTGAITGWVVDRATGAAISGALVTLAGAPRGAHSDSAGRFAHRALAAGTYLLQVRAVGYVPSAWIIELADGEVREQHVALEVAVYEVDSLVVVGHTERWQAGFEERRAKGRGHYVTADELRRSGATRLSDVLRTVPGVRMTCRVSGCSVWMARSPRECAPDYVMDGYPATNAVSSDMPLVGVLGIEIYRTLSETPMQFLRSNNRCGTVVIWTRSGP